MVQRHQPTSAQGIAIMLFVSQLHSSYAQRVTGLDYAGRLFTSSPSADVPHVIKSAPNEAFTYGGTMTTGNYIALADVTLNTAAPCIKTVAGGTATSRSSGPVQAPGGSSTVTIPQSTLLDSFEGDGSPKVYAVCSATGDGSATDDSWEDSNIRLQVSAVASISAHALTHKMTGHIAKVDNLRLTFGGTLGGTKWISLVDRTLNSNLPCEDGTEAAHAAGTVYSGPLQGTANVITVDTEAMTTTTGGGFGQNVVSIDFAVCYSVDGGTTDTW